MKILVTTSYSILEIDTNTENIGYIHRGDGLYYGLARKGNELYVAARKRMVSSSTPLEDERGEILVFDTEFTFKSRIKAPFPLRDLHQITWHNEKLWATCPYDNMIVIWDGVSWQQWFPLSERSDTQRDLHHYNSLLFEEDVVWILAHNHGPSELLAFSLHDRSLLRRIMVGTQSHNIWREEKKLYTCSSWDGMILGEHGFSLTVGGFPRGYAYTGQERCVGISELAERKERDLTTGRVLVFDANWRLLKTITLRGEGLVLDLCAI